MNRKRLLGLTSMAIMTGAFLAGCQSDDKATEPTEKVAKVTEEVKQTLAEQGYVLKSVSNYGDNVNVVYLDKQGKTFVGTVDDNFKWLMEPTDQYKTLEFHEGLAAVAVPEDREMVLANNPTASKWGFINAKGEFVIKPIYRSVQHFSDGVAIVETIEEDRDDLGNSRIIVIDNTGKEIGEMQGTHPHKEKVAKNLVATSFTGGYAYAEDGFYDKKGTFTKMELNDANYFAMNGKRYENDGTENLEIFARSLSGEVLNKFAADGESLNIYIPEDNHTFEQLIKNNVVLVEGNDQMYLLDASSFNVLLRGKIQTGLGEGLLFIEDVNGTEVEGSIAKNGTFFDYNGKKVATVQNMVGPFFEDRYFSQGNEYFTLVDTVGNVLVGEDKKITEVEVTSYEKNKEVNPFKNVVRVKYRESASDVEPNDGLLNLETLEIVDVQDLLKHKTKPVSK